MLRKLEMRLEEKLKNYARNFKRARQLSRCTRTFPLEKVTNTDYEENLRFA